MCIFCVSASCIIRSWHRCFGETCGLYFQLETTLILKMEAARSKAKPVLICYLTRCQNPEYSCLMNTPSEGLEICRIRVCLSLCLSVVLSVCPSSVPAFNYGHQCCRYDFTQLAVNIVKSEISPHQCAVKHCLHEQRHGKTENFGGGNISTSLS